jgi:hypothetical protein
MIGQRQIAFRREYRSRIMGWYDGYLHLAIMYGIGGAAFYIYVQFRVFSDFAHPTDPEESRCPMTSRRSFPSWF